MVAGALLWCGARCGCGGGLPRPTSTPRIGVTGLRGCIVVEKSVVVVCSFLKELGTGGKLALSKTEVHTVFDWNCGVKFDLLFEQIPSFGNVHSFACQLEVIDVD